MNATHTTVDNFMVRFDNYLKHTGLDKKQYQYDGVKWCVDNEIQTDHIDGVKGGILADEMGLGKTITMIGLCLTHFVRRTLIVVPVPLVEQWAQQITKTTGHVPLIYYGKSIKKINLISLLKAPIVITTYSTILISLKNIKKKLGIASRETLRSIPIKYLTSLHQIKWDRIIYDEAHHLRNGSTSRYLGAKSLVSNIKWLVTGTPVQNNNTDLKCLLSFIGFKAMSYLGGRGGFDSDKLKIILQKYYLKRTKKQVGINIPNAEISNIYVDWKNSDEMKLSQDIHSGLQFAYHGNGSGIDNKFLAYSSLLSSPLIKMVRARQSCIFPKLLENAFAKAGKKDTYCLNAFHCTSKIDAIVNFIISRKDNGNGKIVFCHFQKEIDEIKERLIQNSELSVSVFDGRSSFTKRMDLLKRTCNVLIMQIQTGCEGLNLQEQYSEIYFTAPHWNPSVEDQAIARCHRIGQKKIVYVFKFQMSGFCGDNNLEDLDERPMSIENYVSTMQDNKRMISFQLLESH